MAITSLAQTSVLKPNQAYFYLNTRHNRVKKSTSSLPPSWPDIKSIVTEDDKPVDNIFSEKQQRLLTESLYNSYESQSHPFVAMANVGLFYAPYKPPLVPDVLLSLDVQMPDDIWEKRSYFVPIYGKPPEVVIEIVSNLKGKEDGTKLLDYASAGVRYYVIFDPENQLKQSVLRVYELQTSSYVLKSDSFLAQVKLGLTLWKGSYENRHETWLRWCDKNGKLILVGPEATKREKNTKEQALIQLEQERQRAKQERQRAEQECQRAEQERQRAEHLAAKLRALGIEPD